jgi:hypothetical protein
MYGSKSRTIKARGKNRKVIRTEMTCLTTLEGSTTLDHVKNEDIIKELKIQPTQEQK